MLIIQQNTPCKIERMSPCLTVISSPRSRSRSPEIKSEPGEIKTEQRDDVDDCMPLDLSVHGGRLSPGTRDSGTESDDSGGRCSPEGADCKAYKKSLMKRYCKSFVKFLLSY